MTKAEAHKILGIRSSTCLKAARNSYLDKRKRLQIQLLPGIPFAARQEAQAELIKIDAAWRTIQAGYTATPTPAKKRSKRPKPTRPSTAWPAAYQKPQTLAEAWEGLISMMPFSRRVSIALLVLVFLLTMLSLLNSLKG